MSVETIFETLVIVFYYKKKFILGLLQQLCLKFLDALENLKIIDYKTEIIIFIHITKFEINPNVYVNKEYLKQTKKYILSLFHLLVI